MKKAVYIFTAIHVLILVSSALAQDNSSQILNGGATISQPIRIYNNTDLNFGIIIPGPSAGNVHVSGSIGAVTLSDPPTASTTTSCTLPGGSGPLQYNGVNAGPDKKVQVASLIVTGEPNTSFSITVAGGASVGSGSQKISVKLDPPSGTGINAAGNAGILSGDGVRAFTLGGILSIGANQASGSYTGTFTVLVCYN